jgi:hypothetical protein
MQRNSLQTIDRVRIAKLLGMTGSTHDGEAVNAMRLANRIVRESGVTWYDVIGATALPSPEVADPLEGWPGGWRGAVETCLDHGHILSAWERSFLVSTLGFRGLSEKQAAVVRRLLDKTVAAGGMP